MPNHVTNYVVILGDKTKVAELAEQALRPDEDGGHSLDFEAIIPMPSGLRITSGSSTNQGLAAFDDDEFAKLSGNPWFPDRYPLIKTREGWRAHLEANEPETLALGRQADENQKLYGCKTWYEWSVQHWGTKWNSYSGSVLAQGDGFLALRFDTAWSSPDPIFDKLEDMGFHVHCFWKDEGGPEGQYGEPAEYFNIYTNVEWADCVPIATDQQGDPNGRSPTEKSDPPVSDHPTGTTG